MLRYYTLPRYLGAWVRPEMPARYTGIWRERYSDGSTYLEERFVEGMRQGRHTEYTTRGWKTEEGHYVSGKRHGTWTWWDVSGNVVAEGVYVAGTKWDGAFLSSHGPHRRCHMIATYRLGRRDGPYSVWSVSYKLEGGVYENDRRHGRRVRRYTEGTGGTGPIAEEGNYVMGRRDGKWKWWTREGHLIAEGEYKDGKEWAGTFVEWDRENLNDPFVCDGERRTRHYSEGVRTRSEREAVHR
jgi:antitoxin component YwqK of YwqJK toxin-antitoxin module